MGYQQYRQTIPSNSEYSVPQLRMLLGQVGEILGRDIPPRSGTGSRALASQRPKQRVERLKPVVEAGVDYSIVYPPRVAYEPAMVERFARDVVPNFS